ncbi:MAG: transposase, partial [Candidatus Sericytochromatia bacterium]|nr:transposase [Candidatus Sericytochromatia bacterium]
MKFNPDIHHRKSIRLKNYDYSQNGAYFITICTNERKMIFSEIINEHSELNPLGKIVENEWLMTSEIRKDIILDEYIV